MVCGLIRTQFFLNFRNVDLLSPLAFLKNILFMGLMNLSLCLFSENENSLLFIYFVSKKQCFLLVKKVEIKFCAPSKHFKYLVSPCVQVHDQVVGLWVPVTDLAFVAVGVPRHLVGHVTVFTVTG